MALLIDIAMPEWMAEEALRDRLVPLLPGVSILCGPDQAGPDIRMLATVRLRPGLAPRLPGLELVQKLGAGVDTMVHAPDLPAHVRLARLAPAIQAEEIAEYCLAYVLRDLRHVLAHARDEAGGAWSPRAPRRARDQMVAVLGLGNIGALTARLFARTGFQVIGWSRTQKTLDGIDCQAGHGALPGLLGAADFVVSILPSTPETESLFNAGTFAMMKPGSVLINAGRGTLLVEDDLIPALSAGRPGGAVLDVTRQEPLPAGHPFWRHPAITITPHVSGWSLGDAFDDVAGNYRRLVSGEPLLHEVDRSAGY